MFKIGENSLNIDEIGSLKERIAGSAPSELVGEMVIDRVPFVFNGDQVAYRRWRESVAPILGVDPCNIFIVGSAGVGCSLNPYKDWKIFDDNSDIDIAVISSYHFDVAWRMMRLTRRADVSGAIWQEIERHRTNYIYWGCIATDKILGGLPFAKDWLAAASFISGDSVTINREVKFRIYRDVSSLRDYTFNGLRGLKADLVL